ncbi:MAG: hypothetical protein IT200_05220 [Thermoleophilia bacterium]|nr:hypothetical protein [Thermoleophilia bacterium]
MAKAAALAARGMRHTLDRIVMRREVRHADEPPAPHGMRWLAGADLDRAEPLEVHDDSFAEDPAHGARDARGPGPHAGRCERLAGGHIAAGGGGELRAVIAPGNDASLGRHAAEGFTEHARKAVWDMTLA